MSEYRVRLSGLTARLASPRAVEERDRLKADIAALFRGIERELVELKGLKAEIYQLVEQWKALPVPREETLPPAALPDGKPIVQADHLGASTFIERGWHQISVGDAVGAETSLTRALQLAPDDPQAEALLGWAQMLQQKYDEALLLFQQVLSRDPNNSLARVNVGYICLKKGIFGEAIEHLTRVIRLENDRKATLYAHFYLGLAYLEREMFEDAENFFRQTLEMGPNFIEAHYELGRARWFAGDHEGARGAWREGFAANKFSPWGKRCAELLETVEGGGTPARVG